MALIKKIRKLLNIYFIKSRNYFFNYYKKIDILIIYFNLINLIFSYDIIELLKYTSISNYFIKLINNK